MSVALSFLAFQRKEKKWWIDFASVHVISKSRFLVFIADAIGLQLNKIRKIVSEMSGKGTEHVRVVVSPYRICPLGAHVDHQVSTLHLYFL